MAERVVVHVGTPKSGTTYLQGLLWSRRDRLREGGVLVPGKRRFDHTQAANAVSKPGEAGRGPEPRHRTWNRLLAEVAAWDGTALISDEWFVRATTEQAEHARSSFGEAEVHVVLTARDLVRLLPSAWQEELKLGRGQSFDAFLGALDDPDGKWCWDSLEPAAVLGRWSAGLDPSRVHLVTAPPGGPRAVLWQRFAAACGVDHRVLDPAVSEANESLSAEAARLFQEIGPGLREAVGADSGPWTLQYRWLRRYVGHRLLMPLGGSRIGMRDADFAAARARAEQGLGEVRRAGWEVVGSLDDLVAHEPDASSRHPDDVSTEELVALAGSLAASLLAEVVRVADEGGP